MATPIHIERIWDQGHETIVIEGIRYSSDIFRLWAGTYKGEMLSPIQEGAPFEIVKGSKEVLTLKVHECKGEKQ